MLRNRELKYALFAWACITLACCTLTFILLHTAWMVFAVFMIALLAISPLLALTIWRYGKLRQLSEQLDAALHDNRSISFTSMREGELAILANELEKMTTRLEHTVDELAHERQSLADSLADISHQLRTPLTSLSIITSLLREELMDQQADRKLMDQIYLIERLQTRIAELVDALLKLARIDAGTISFISQTVPMQDLLTRASEPLAISYDLANITLAVNVDMNATFTGDVAWTAEALENILKNCIEHTPSGGTVTVRAIEDTLARRIIVEDTGTGIAPEDLPHIFERFYRGSASSSSDVNPVGIGIGLALARALVAAQGGSLTAENATSKDGTVTGARFKMIFFKTPV